MTLAIDVHDLSKTFGTLQAVDHVSIQIEQGHITGFLGPNGSGKTTTLRMLCGLLTPESGSGQVLGLDFPREAEAIKRQTGYMTQRFSLYEDLTIEENLAFIARVYSLDNIPGRVADTLEKLGLADRRKQLAGQLSGGWKQRLALAAAVMHEPRLLLLDEPTAGVDPQARRDFWDESHRLARDLAGKSGVDMVAPFGAALHVSGTDRARLETAIQPFRRDPWRWTEVPPSLEDVFIHLMRERGGQQAQQAA